MLVFATDWATMSMERAGARKNFGPSATNLAFATVADARRCCAWSQIGTCRCVQPRAASGKIEAFVGHAEVTLNFRSLGSYR